jgi:hypothetical protein
VTWGKYLSFSPASSFYVIFGLLGAAYVALFIVLVDLVSLDVLAVLQDAVPDLRVGLESGQLLFVQLEVSTGALP